MPEVEDEEKDDGSRAAGGGPSTTVPLPTVSFYRGPLPIFLRTQHVVSAFIIIVIIISVDGPLMKRRLGRPGEIQEVREEGGRVDLSRHRKNSKKQKLDRTERIRRRGKRRGRKNDYQAKEKLRGKKRAPIAGFVVGLLVICSFDIIASKLFGGT